MAKKRYNFMKRRISRSVGRFSRRVRRGGSSENLVMTAVAAAAYGALRPKVEQMVAPLSAKIPIAGAYTDEVLLGGAGYLLARGKFPIVKGKLARSVGKAVLIIEAARVGSGVSSQFLK